PRTARPVSATTTVRPMSPCLTDSVPPPGGSRNPCAQPFTGAPSGASGRPFTLADQPPAGSASTSVPPVAGTRAPVTRTGPEATGITVPLGSVTVTRAAVSTTRQSWNEVVALTGRRPGTASSNSPSSRLRGPATSPYRHPIPPVPHPD